MVTVELLKNPSIRLSVCAATSLRLSVLASFMVLTVSAQEVDAANLLAKIGAFDDAVLEGSTLRFSVVQPVPRDGLDTESIVAEGEITRIGDAWLMRRRTSDQVKAPEYSELKGKGNQVSTDEPDTYYVPRTIELTVLSENDQISSIETACLYQVTPSGVDVVVPEILNVELAKRHSPLQDPMLYSLVLCAGRGYSSYVSGITSVQELESGLYSCSGFGSYPAPNSSLSCTWELIVDPQSAYMVREAKATRSDGSIIAHFKNEGLAWYEKGPLPTEGTFALAPNRGYYEGDGLVRVTFLSLLDEVDNGAMVDVLTFLATPFPVGTNVTDERGEKPVMFTNGLDTARDTALDKLEREVVGPAK